MAKTKLPAAGYSVRSLPDKLGFKPDFFNVSVRELKFPYGERTIRLPYASAEGVLQVTDAELLKKPLLRGVGSYRRVGLGLLQLSS